jgi:hypothetical protein
MDTNNLRYYLCSAAVVEHFPNLKRSLPFDSGYDHDRNDVYYVIATDDFHNIERYYNEVIEPFNEKSTVADIDFWLRECCDSQLDPSPIGCDVKCKRHGIFLAIEKMWNLSNESNRAFAIYKMAERCVLNPIGFVNRVARLRSGTKAKAIKTGIELIAREREKLGELENPADPKHLNFPENEPDVSKYQDYYEPLLYAIANQKRDYKKELIRTGALIAAEIDRINNEKKNKQ